jgi:tetratricopeptide (TPR) repeat protein
MHNLQAGDHFIGRSNELNIFKQWLADPDARRILYFHDALKGREKKGGVGKTWLLNKYLQIARQDYPNMAIVIIDFFNVGERNGVVVAERIVEALQAAFSDWIPTAFSEAITEYRNIHKPDDVEVAEVRSALFKALTSDLQHLDRQLAIKQKALLVFYDTYEIIEQNPIIAVLRFSQKFPDTYQFEHMYTVIAGRNALDWTHPNWKGREQVVEVVALAPFSHEEIVEYINIESIYHIDTHSRHVEALYKLTEGRPILIGLATDVLNKHIMTLERLVEIPLDDFAPHLVMHINNLEHLLNWIILFMAHAYHRFNLEILNWILPESNLKRLIQDVQFDELAANLPTLSFVHRADFSEDFVLHDEMRRLVNKYCWPLHDKGFHYRNAISRSMIDYYEHVMAEEPRQQKRQTYRIEVLFHKLFLDVSDGFQYFKKHFYGAIRLWQSPFARTLLQEAQQFEHIMSSDQRNCLKMALARLLRAEENPAEALTIYETLEREADEQWDAEYRLSLLSGKAACYLALNRLLEAIDSFTQCLEIDRALNDEPAIANRLGRLGLTYRHRGQFDTAVHYYEESIALHKRLNNQREYANMLNSISEVYKLQGKLDEALLRCKIALRIYNDLFRAGNASEFLIGLTLSTMGKIYLDMDTISNAEEAFQQAYEIYHRANGKRSMASTLNRFGQIAIARSNWQEAKQWFEQAQEASAGIDVEVYINSLNQQGRLLAKQGNWIEAVAFFEQAVNLAKQIHDDLQYTENLVDLAEALACTNQRQKALQLLQEAEQISLKWFYFHLLGRAAEFQGDIDYNAGHYEDAFIHYGAYCYYMARRNEHEYGKALHKLTDQIVGVPRNKIHPIIESLVTYWYKQKMHEEYPDFTNTCKDADVLP